MHQRKVIEFKRGLKALATQMEWQVEIANHNGPTERIVLSYKEGRKKRRLATIVLRADRKDVSAGEARMLLRNLRGRVHSKLQNNDGAEQGKNETDSTDPNETWIENAKELIEWISSWF